MKVNDLLVFKSVVSTEFCDVEECESEIIIAGDLVAFHPQLELNLASLIKFFPDEVDLLLSFFLDDGYLVEDR